MLYQEWTLEYRSGHCTVIDREWHDLSTSQHEEERATAACHPDGLDCLATCAHCSEWTYLM